MPNFDPKEEAKFQGDFANLVETIGINPNPDNPLHFYDYRKAWKAGKMTPGPGGHFSSEFKLPGHPNRFVDGVDTITGEKAGMFDVLENMLANLAVRAAGGPIRR
jgi:hypothetical protein